MPQMTDFKFKFFRLSRSISLFNIQHQAKYQKNQRASAKLSTVIKQIFFPDSDKASKNFAPEIIFFVFMIKFFVPR